MESVKIFLLKIITLVSSANIITPIGVQDGPKLYVINEFDNGANISFLVLRFLHTWMMSHTKGKGWFRNSAWEVLQSS
jgi:hypothetical protein